MIDNMEYNKRYSTAQLMHSHTLHINQILEYNNWKLRKITEVVVVS